MHNHHWKLAMHTCGCTTTSAVLAGYHHWKLAMHSCGCTTTSAILAGYNMYGNVCVWVALDFGFSFFRSAPYSFWLSLSNNIYIYFFSLFFIFSLSLSLFSLFLSFSLSLFLSFSVSPLSNPLTLSLPLVSHMVSPSPFSISDYHV